MQRESSADDVKLAMLQLLSSLSTKVFPPSHKVLSTVNSCISINIFGAL